MNIPSTKIQRALVTGGSRGIGFHITKMLIKQGIDVCIAGKNSEHLENARERLTVDDEANQLRGKVYIVPIDLEKPDAPRKLIQTAGEKLGSLDLLVNNAGISLNLPLEKTTIQDWDRVMHINARAPFFLCQEALPWLRKSAAPTIIQIASVVSHAGYELQSAYSASKHALLGFTKAFAKEVQQEDIRIYTLSPGGVATKMIDSVRPDLDQEDLIDPQEIANMIWFLLTHRGNAMIDHVTMRRVKKTAWI
jgi:3-oxoacyl-[acyl-carrier protein] reductase